MTPEELADYALTLPETWEDEPFGPGVLVYKVAGKMFAILSGPAPGQPGRVTLKCDPGLALHLREQYAAVTPGYHTNKRHWNTVLLDGSVPADELREMVDHSYAQVIAGLRKADRERLTLLHRQD
ncbi:MmcQ/YjbR family DNA-binding protein [Streptomyces sp. ODS28]|uniref:MmcQ/YjbR family DNA-binding protein n=1 Tax=Streptomyces sp. ODS28 TaxID=3136688 RepID=UPI0031E58380